MENAEDDDKSRSPSFQQRALSSSPPPSDNPPRSGVVLESEFVSIPWDEDGSIYPESHLAIAPQTFQGALSYADITRRVLPSSNSQAVMSAVDRIHSIHPYTLCTFCSYSEPTKPHHSGAPSESPHVRDEVKGSGYPNEQSHTMFSASSPRPPLSSEDTAPAVGSPSQPQTVSGPRSLGRSNSRIQEDEGAGRELTPDKERKPKTVSKEPESRQEDPATDTSRARRHKPEPTPPSSYTSPQSSIGRTYSSDLSRKNDFGVPPPRSDTSKLGGNSGHSSDSLPSSGVTQASFTPPVSLSLQNQPKHGIGTSPNNNPTSSSADPHSQLRTVASNSETHASPTLSRTTSSRASAPIARKPSREVRKEGETLPKPIPPPKSLPSVGQPSSTTLPPSSQKRPAGSSRDTGDDTFSRLPDDHHCGETPTLSVVQADSPQEAVENKPLAKSSDRVGLVQSVGTSSFVSLIDFDTCPLFYPTASTAPSMVKASFNMKEERRTEAQSGHSFSQLQYSQRDSGGMVPPNEPHRPETLTTRQTEIHPSGQATATGELPSIYFPPGTGFLLTAIPPGDRVRQAAGINQTGFQRGHGPNSEHLSPPPPYTQKEAPSATSVAQEGSRPQAGVPTEVRDEPNKSSGKKYPIFSSPPLSSQQQQFFR